MNSYLIAFSICSDIFITFSSYILSSNSSIDCVLNARKFKTILTYSKERILVCSVKFDCNLAIDNLHTITHFALENSLTKVNRNIFL